MDVSIRTIGQGCGYDHKHLTNQQVGPKLFSKCPTPRARLRLFSGWLFEVVAAKTVVVGLLDRVDNHEALIAVAGRGVGRIYLATVRLDSERSVA